MKKDITVFVKVCLKNLTSIKEGIVFINSDKDEITDRLKTHFKEDANGCITINDTFVHTDDISAVEIKVVESI